MSFLGEAFGRVIKARRKELNLSQTRFASAMEVEPPTASRWETGASLPVNDRIDRILEVLRITPTEFVEAMAGVDKTIDAVDERVLESIERGVAKTLGKSSPGIPDDILEALIKATPAQLNLVRGALGIFDVTKHAPQSQIVAKTKKRG